MEKNPDKITPRQAMEKVFTLMGTKTAVARLCKVTNQAISRWHQVPIRHCPVLEMATEGKISCRQMRPDFPWPRRG